MVARAEQHRRIPRANTRINETLGTLPPAAYAASLFDHAHESYPLSVTMQSLDIVLAYRRNPHQLPLLQLSELLLNDRGEMSRIVGKARRDHRGHGVSLPRGWERTIPSIIGEVFRNAETFSVLDTDTIEYYLAFHQTLIDTPLEKRGEIKTRIKRELMDLVSQIPTP